MLLGNSQHLSHTHFGICSCKLCAQIDSDRRLSERTISRRRLKHLLEMQHEGRMAYKSMTRVHEPYRPARRWFEILVPIFLFCALPASSGCSSTSKVERRTVTHDSSPDYYGNRDYQRTEETTVKTTKEESSSCSGVLSCGIDAIGTVIAFPFKAAGALIGAIF
jgi:hypothetical protein